MHIIIIIIVIRLNICVAAFYICQEVLTGDIWNGLCNYHRSGQFILWPYLGTDGAECAERTTRPNLVWACRGKARKSRHKNIFLTEVAAFPRGF